MSRFYAPSLDEAWDTLFGGEDYTSQDICVRLDEDFDISVIVQANETFQAMCCGFAEGVFKVDGDLYYLAGSYGY